MGQNNTVGGSDPDAVLGSICVDDIAALADETRTVTQPAEPMPAGFERSFSDLSTALEQRSSTSTSESDTATPREQTASPSEPIRITDSDGGLLAALEAGAVDLDTVSPKQATDSHSHSHSLDQAAAELLESLEDQ